MKKKEIETKVLENGCIEVMNHATNEEGYPVKYYKGKVRRISRIVYEQHKGEIPDGMCVRHTCDNRKCINVEHLILGNHNDNMADKKGHVHILPKKKLTAEDRHEIRQSLRPKKELCLQYGVTRQYVYKLQKGRGF